eukprot:Gregarina_sp_Poly_1__2682@NODE_1736_length_3435_cov_323_458135_g1137_i0_p1_GENE_NODE_1736_length_3435_cov_323_458135_g1137_i0NODE_1736_length_3435_cov_323_458135_g1137_i0_p1_ORF_typecomplete_len1037_score119_00Ank_2/PF12796_7/1_8e08Ank_2/PF12796_7/3_7e08Ank_5/PF13857_6/1_7e09Ank_5/PF13857_6/2_5e07Ank_4/PF13637_6/1_8e04Ank_4/PF13637_6/1_1e06Ank_4/PF13637_6/1_4e07Ank_4/PF13637_6/0_0012Ank_4/PF13637_6/2_8Ank/PF00023_30/1_2e07Ank/PF00023_30/0_0048Ank_3/PF13606_6/1_4e07Ank_3/PF13606_6/0_0036DUF2207/P
MKTGRSLWLLLAAIFAIHVAGGNLLSVSDNSKSDRQAALNRNLDKFGCPSHDFRDNTGPISWGLLRAISVLTPVESWASKATPDDATYDDLFDNYGTAQVLKWMVWGVLSASVGAAWLLVCLFVICPLLWIKPCRRWVCKDIDLRNRTSILCNHITFWICLVLGIACTLGLIYHVAWLTPDIERAECLKEVFPDYYNTTYTTNIASSKTLLSELEHSIDQILTITQSSEKDLDFAVPDALAEIWGPLLPFSSAWENIYLIDANLTNDISVPDMNYFWLSLGGHWIQDEKSVDWKVANTDLLNIYNLTKINTLRRAANDELESSLRAMKDVVNQTLEYFGLERSEVGSNLAPFYANFLAETSKAANQSIFNKPRRRVALLFFAVLPCIGIISALYLFILYMRERASGDFKKRPPSRWQLHFTAFMVFGYAVGGILLFLIGGATMAVAFFPSDACRHLNENGDTTRALTFSADDLRNRCRRPDEASEDEISGRSQSPIANHIKKTQERLKSFFDKEPSLLMPSIFKDLIVVPIVPKNSKYPDPFLTGLDYEEVPLDPSVVSALSANSPNWFSWFDAGHIGFGGIRELQETLADSRPECAFCIHPYCSDGEIMTSPESFKLPVWDEYLGRILESDKHGLVTLLTDRDDTSLHKALGNCGPDSSAANFETWWSALFVLFYRGAVLYEGWSSSELISLNSSPLFFRLRNQTDPMQGSQPIPYSEWSNTFAFDIQAVVDFHQSPNFRPTLESYSMNHSMLSKVYNQYETVIREASCRVAVSANQDMYFKDMYCDSVPGDIGAGATFCVWLGVLHLIAFSMTLAYWLPRRRFKDKVASGEQVANTGSGASGTSVKGTPTPYHGKPGITEKELYHACETGDQRTVLLALERYPPNSISDMTYCNTPLHLAAYYGHVEVVELLCTRGWNPNEFNFRRHTPFTACVSNLYLETETKIKVLTILKDHGAWIDVYTGDGDTPLMIATRANERDIVWLLLEWNANPLKRDEDYNWSSLKLAESMNNHEVYELLREASPKHKGSPRHGDF